MTAASAETRLATPKAAVRTGGAVAHGRARRGAAAEAAGRAAETLACAALERDGWTILGRRLRTPAGEIDVAAEKTGLLALVEVKARPSLAVAAAALGAAQQRRLADAAEILLTRHSNWGRAGVRFDLMVVDGQGRVRRVADAFRLG
ncbi:MAG TPA: YraN family protein [Acetobacteraceae bacterium]|nr:YraN family protein [Acetobacteraceae bacterium]